MPGGLLASLPQSLKAVCPAVPTKRASGRSLERALLDTQRSLARTQYGGPRSIRACRVVRPPAAVGNSV
jgi:hypothetical protein